MAGTSIKNVNGLMNSISVQVSGIEPAGAASQTKDAKASFSEVLSSQTVNAGNIVNKPDVNVVKNAPKNENGENKDASNLKKDNDGKDIAKIEKAQKPEGKGEIKEDFKDNTIKSDENMDVTETSEAAMEVLATAVTEVVEIITDNLDITPEEVENLLSEMGISASELLDENTLGDFLIKALGGNEKADLLTDAALYGEYNEALSEAGDILNGVTDIQGLSIGELYERMDAEFKEELSKLDVALESNKVLTTAEDAITGDLESSLSVDEDGEPVVEIKVTDDSGNTASDSTIATDEGSTLGLKAMLERTKNEKEASHDDQQGNQGGNLQNQFNQDFQINAEAAIESQSTAQTSGFSEETMNIMRQVMDYMRVSLNPETTEMEMQLHPASLGSIQVKLQSTGGNVTASFIAQNEAVRAALESQMVQLKESFEAQGIKVEEIEVTVASHAFEQNLEQGQQNKSAEENNLSAGSARRSRRVNLGDEASGEEEEELTEADRIDRELMQADGRTVDYTA
ncbi:MAG: flagellar hook-length control protein FliK [Lachnospiraceae bacterium]|nr:flagellar hook-length control protein FliK [Lachnospiraceae bacterium]